MIIAHMLKKLRQAYAAAQLRDSQACPQRAALTPATGPVRK